MSPSGLILKIEVVMLRNEQLQNWYVVVAIVALALAIIGVILTFFFEVFNASRWECKKYDQVQTVWVDYDQTPPVLKGQKQQVCVVNVRGK